MKKPATNEPGAGLLRLTPGCQAQAGDVHRQTECSIDPIWEAMEMSTTGKPKVCVYCGAAGPLTSDHVPPRSLFPDHERGTYNMITVAACGPCNAGFSKDDEYFMFLLSVRADLPAGISTAYLRSKTRKMVSRPEAARFKANMQKALTQVELPAADGVGRVKAAAISIDSARIERTTKRIVHGLHVHYLGFQIPPTHELDVYVVDFQRPEGFQTPEVVELYRVLTQHGVHQELGSVLDVRYARAEDDLMSSVWRINIHGAFTALAFVGPPDADDETA